MTNLKLFSQYFIGEIATNDKQRDESRALRWQVYCEERDFEAKQEHTNQIEADTYDWHSLHFNIRCRATREVVASVRLVMSHPYEPKRPLPAERYADAAFLACGHRYQRHQIAEISRFAVSKKKMNSVLDLVPQHDRKAVASLLTPALMAMVLAASDIYGIQGHFAIMAPSLRKRLEREGLSCEPVGPSFEYKGIRQSYFSHYKTAIEEVEQRFTSCHYLIKHFMEEFTTPFSPTPLRIAS